MNARLHYLFDRFLEKTCTAEERQELMGFALEPGMQEEIQELITAAAGRTGEEFDIEKEKADAFFQKVMAGDHSGSMQATLTDKRVHRIHSRKLQWWAAAVVLITIGISSYFLFLHNRNKNGKGDGIVNIKPPNDVKPPETNRAMITLADGRIVYLDSANNGELAMQGNSRIIKLANGKIIYEVSANINEDGTLRYNTLNNPRGSKVIDMALADGSHVWLNAGSSVRYPVAFAGNERKVEITGEAYFEVAPDKTKPFKVSKGNMTIEVLGTHFNVNAYDDEEDIKVTLLEGSVKVTSDQQQLIIKPNQQVVVANNQVTLNKAVDTEQVMAWKNGYFKFSAADIETIMRQMEKWYNVDINYKEKPSQLFVAKIPRTVNASDFLRILEATGWVNFTIEGRTITVSR